MKNNLRLVLIAVMLLVLAGGFFVLKTGVLNKEKNFEVDMDVIRISMKENNSLRSEILVSSYSDLSFKVQSSLDFVLIESEEFLLNSGQEKRVGVLYDITGKEPGVYIGKIDVVGGENTITIPVILEIETEEIFFDSNLNVPVEYNVVYPGESLVVENIIFNLESIGSKNIQVDYFIKSFEGKIISSSESENLVVESNTPITKTFSLPANTLVGDYVVITIIRYKDSVGTSTDFFKIANKNFEYYFSGDNFYMWIVFILLLIVILFILYNMRQKDQFLLELARQHREALSHESQKLKQEKEKLKKLPESKKKVELRKFKVKKKKRYGAIKSIYRRRVKVVKKLKKHKKKDEIKKKLREWKKQGYNVREFAIHSGKNKIGDKVGKFKKEGFKY